MPLRLIGYAVLSVLPSAATALPAARPSIPFAFEQRGHVFSAQSFGAAIEVDAQAVTIRSRAGSLRISPQHANPRAAITGQGNAGTRNWFIGNRASAWKTDVPLFERVQVSAVYPGIDLVYYGRDSHLEYDFVITPHADPRRISLQLEGAARLHLSQQGDLRIAFSPASAVDAFLQHRPVAYQSIAGERRIVPCRYVLEAGNRVRFALGPYDRSKPLTIDPIVAYSSYLGGIAIDEGHAVALDSSGNFYIAGRTLSGTQGNSNVLLFKFPPSGPPVQSVFGGTTGDDSANAIAVDSSGIVYLAGGTSSLDFPVAGTYVYQASLIGTMNAFVLALTPANTSMIFSTFLGGSYADQALAMALGPQNNLFIVGDTTSPNVTFITNSAFQTVNYGGYDAFLVSLTSTGVLKYGTYIGGTADEHAYGVAVDSKGAAYAVGVTTSSDYPASPYPPLPLPFQAANHGSADGFAIKLFPSGQQAYWSTYLGGASADSANAVAVDSKGNVYIAGTTGSDDFPAFTGAYQLTYQGGGSDGFVMLLQNNGRFATWSTFLGSPGADSVNALALDSSNNIVVTGSTDSLTFPVTADAVQSTNAGKQDILIATVANNGASLLFSSYLGGSGDDIGTGVALDASGRIYLTGTTASSNNDFPVTAGARQLTYGGGATDAFFSILGCPNTVPVIASGGITSAASFRVDAITPGSVISLFGTNLACTASAASAVPLPTSLGSVSVKINDKAAPLFYVGEGQINAQVPYEVAVGTANVTVTTPAGTSAAASFPVATTGPGIFGVNGDAAAFNQDGKTNSASNGAKPGTYITLFFTGQGPVSQAVATGAATPQPPPLVTATSTNSATIGGIDAPVAFMGLAPGLVGLAQANLVVPQLASGSYPVILTVGGVASAPANITVSQ